MSSSASVNVMPFGPGPVVSCAEAVVSTMRDAVVSFDESGAVMALNPAAKLMFGHRAGGLIGQHYEMALGASARPAVRGAVDRYVRAGPPYVGPSHVELVQRHESGAGVQLTPLRYFSDEGWRGALILRDDSEQTAFTRLLEHEATHDALTGLPNRAFLRDLLTQALARAGNDRSQVAVLFVGLDGFRALNDARGYEAGDVVLSEIARRLRRIVPASDAVVRAGGDEFVIVVETKQGADAVWLMAETIRSTLERPFRAAGGSLFLSACVGMVVADKGHGTPASLLQQADAALHRAKDHGPGQLEMFREGLRAKVRARHDLEVAVKEAHLASQLEMHYQPLVSLNPLRWSGFEALLRWKNGAGEYISPATFVPALERTGQIVSVGAWVLEEACTQLMKWRAKTGQEHLHIGVNLSVRQIERPDVVDMVRGVLGRTGLKPEHLMLEVTESALALDMSGVIRRLAALRDLGITIAIDDFGTGYSSLAYLHRLPVDLLKIDQSFVARLDGPDGDSAIVEAISALARTIGLKVIAEGVETPIQLSVLKALGVDLIQGFHFARPVPGSEIEAILATPPKA